MAVNVITVLLSALSIALVVYFWDDCIHKQLNCFGFLVIVPGVVLFYSSLKVLFDGEG